MYSVQWHLIKFVEQKERACEKASDLLKKAHLFLLHFESTWFFGYTQLNNSYWYIEKLVKAQIHRPAEVQLLTSKPWSHIIHVLTALEI